MLRPSKRFAVIDRNGFKHAIAIEETAVGYGDHRLFLRNKPVVDQDGHTCGQVAYPASPDMGQQENARPMSLEKHTRVADANSMLQNSRPPSPAFPHIPQGNPNQ